MKYQKIAAIVREANPNKNKFELSEKQIQTLRNGAEIALAVIAAAGVTTIALIAPNLLQALSPLLKRSRSGRRLSQKERETKTARVFYYLKKHSYISLKPDKNDFKILLTNLGRKKLDRLTLKTCRPPKEGKWNQRWWQVAADIPTKEYKRGADLFRKKIKQMQFYSLQRTLWFYPFDPRAEIEYIARYYNIAQFVTVMEVLRMDKEDEAQLKKHFTELKIL